MAPDRTRRSLLAVGGAAALAALGSLIPGTGITPAGAQQSPSFTPDPRPYSEPTPIPTPTARPEGSAPRVGLQVGHWKSKELPEELARLRTSSGAFSDGYAEVDINLAIAQRVEKLLIARGVVVDLLPATVPPAYDADAFVAIHADGATTRSARGFKVATPWRTSQASAALADALSAEYGKATGMPRDGAITINMRGYYAFNYRRHEHAVARTTPAVILEMGFLTSPTDRAILFNRADRVAAGIANGIIGYLNARDPLDGAALLPPDFPIYRVATDQVAVRSAPSEKAKILVRIDRERRLMPFQERDGWLEVLIRDEWRTIGWVRKSDLIPTNDALPPPPPSSDGS